MLTVKQKYLCRLTSALELEKVLELKSKEVLWRGPYVIEAIQARTVDACNTEDFIS